MFLRIPQLLAVVLAVAAWSPALAAPHPDGELKVDVVDAATGKSIPARLHLSLRAGELAGVRSEQAHRDRSQIDEGLREECTGEEPTQRARQL